MKKKILSTITMLSLVMASVTAQAGVHTDSSGNVGYDTLAECQAALANGSAKFYKSHTFKPPLLRKGEKAVKQARLGDLHEAFRAGTCDVGTGHRLGRDGVSKALQGKYIPYSPEMTINAYSNGNGEIVRVTMQQCDNWFSGNFPKATFLQGSAPTSGMTTPATMTPTPVVPTAVATLPAVAPAVAGATAGTTGAVAGTAGATAGTTGAAAAGAVAGATAGATGAAAAGAVAAAQGITSMIIPLGVLGAIGVGTAVLMNSDDSSAGAGTTGTTGTR